MQQNAKCWVRTSITMIVGCCPFEVWIWGNGTAKEQSLSWNANSYTASVILIASEALAVNWCAYKSGIPCVTNARTPDAMLVKILRLDVFSKWLCDLPTLTGTCFWILILLPAHRQHCISCFAHCHDDAQVVACRGKIVIRLITQRYLVFDQSPL